MKKQSIFLVPAALFMIALVPSLPASASSSNDNSDDDSGPSCSPITGNPFQEECGEDRLQGHPTSRGDVFCGPEDTVTNTPQVCVLRPD